MQLDQKVASLGSSLRGHIQLGGGHPRGPGQGEAAPLPTARRAAVPASRLPPPGGRGPAAPAYLTGSCRRWNQLQQLAIRLSIPGRSSLRLPSEPGAGRGPRWPRAESRTAFPTKSLRAVSLGGGAGREVRATVSPSKTGVTAPARERTTTAPLAGEGGGGGTESRTRAG